MITGKALNETEIQLAIANLQGRMTVVEQGVANFRAFQKDARDFFARHDAREQERDKVDRKRSRIHYALLSGLIALIVGCAVALFTWVLSGHHEVSAGQPAISQMQDSTISQPITEEVHHDGK